MKFQDLNLSNQLLNAIAEMGYEKPTTIQQRAFAPIMAGNDVLGIAQTGTGKTCAYLLPLIRQWQFAKKKNVEIIVIVPTRELVVQVLDEIEKLTKYTSIKATAAYGGTNIKTQIMAIVAGVDIVVATPGRLLDLMLNGTIPSKYLKKIVLDEVDEMLNLGFRHQLKNIFDLLPEKKQTLMFSATITEEVELVIKSYIINAIKIEAAPTGTPLENIEQIGYTVPNFNTKINLLEHLLYSDSGMTKVLIFAASKKLADELNSRMEEKFADQMAVIHSNKTQNTRFKTVREFENGTCKILIATDIIARGLDVSSVSHVVNMDVPEIAENYIHRIGRTGRANKTGIAITFITEKDNKYKEKVETLMGQKILLKEIPDKTILSSLLIAEEQPVVNMKLIEVKRPKVIPKGKSHHEKKEKNKKVNVKVSRDDLKKIKYGKKYKSERRS
jgi:ATP-dependent RNA helicase RhlE